MKTKIQPKIHDPGKIVESNTGAMSLLREELVRYYERRQEDPKGSGFVAARNQIVAMTMEEWRAGTCG